MMKRITYFLLTLMICFGMFQMDCSAAELDPTRSCSLTLFYSSNGTYFSNLNIEIYRVAKVNDNGMYELLEPFSNYPINIYGITSQQEWRDTAQTIKNYVAANQIESYGSQKSDISGQVYFTGLETGLYMVKGTTARNGGKSVIFYDFMVYLPTPEGNGYNYNVQAKPKFEEYTPPVKHTVFKLWKDAGATEKRPESIEVDILKDGEVQETVVLGHDNNWFYSWETTGSDGVWTVMEKDVKEDYQVSITNTQTIFMITNTYAPTTPEDPKDPEDPEDPDKPKEPEKPNTPDKPEEPETPDDPGVPNVPTPPSVDKPKTGDTAPLLLYAIIACISGFGLIIFSVWRLREKDEKKR